eukprot:6113062-Pleurochrysis_carterae.AAC.1
MPCAPPAWEDPKVNSRSREVRAASQKLWSRYEAPRLPSFLMAAAPGGNDHDPGYILRSFLTPVCAKLPPPADALRAGSTHHDDPV